MRSIPLMDVDVSLVGGAVRDALLGIAESEDVDLVVEGDAVTLAERLGHHLSVRVVTHGRFGTAYLELPHERWIDLATARRERYPVPGGLPVVEPGSLADDLARRDFSINAIAYRLTGPHAGAIVDPQGGREDIDARLIRILHPESFVEDPSRLLRAVRYASRLGFMLDATTADAAARSAARLDHRSARVGDELRRLLSEPRAAGAVNLASQLGVPWLSAPADLADRFECLDDALAHPDAPALTAWALRLGLTVAPELISEVAVDGWARGLALEAAAGPSLSQRLASISRPSELDSVLMRAKPATVVAAFGDAPERIGEWWSTRQRLSLAVNGEDLVRAGVTPGPAIGRALAAVRAALLDGQVSDDAQSQLALAIEVVSA